MSDEKPLSHEIRRSVTAEGLPLRQWADRAAALEAEAQELREALATIWAALDVDVKLDIERVFDEAALQARKAFYAREEAQS